MIAAAAIIFFKCRSISIPKTTILACNFVYFKNFKACIQSLKPVIPNTVQ